MPDKRECLEVDVVRQLIRRCRISAYLNTTLTREEISALANVLTWTQVIETGDIVEAEVNHAG